MDINLHSLHVFMKLCEVKNFTKTALTLGMTQPGVSQHIKSLEDYFETSLINRHGKSFEITAEGCKVLKYGKDLFYKHKIFKDGLSSDAHTAGVCYISSPGSVGIKLYKILLELNKKHPKLQQHFYYAPNSSIESQLLTNQIDLGVMSKMPESDLLTIKEIAQERLLLLTPKNTEIKKYSDLQNLGFINHPDGKDMATKLLTANFKEFTVFENLKLAGANNQINRILEPVSMGLGYTVLPNFAFDDFRMKSKLKVLTLKKEVTSSIYIVRKKFRPLPKRYDFIEEYITKMIK